MPHRTLIVAYGNPLRSDDGFAWHAAQMLRPTAEDLGAQILCEYQLSPELAATASTADLLIFIDAACHGQPGQLVCTAVLPHPEPLRFSHQLSPEQILALCGELYAAHPHAYAISVTGESFAHGESLSDSVREALAGCVSIAEELMTGHRELHESSNKVETWHVVHCNGHDAEVW